MLTEDKKVLEKVIAEKKQSLHVAEFRMKDSEKNLVRPSDFVRFNRMKARHNKISDEVASLTRILIGTSY